LTEVNAEGVFDMESGKWNYKDVVSGFRHAVAPPIAFVLYEVGTKIVDLIQSDPISAFNWAALVAAAKLGAGAGVGRFIQRWMSDIRPKE
jgi:hypothetical protein